LLHLGLFPLQLFEQLFQLLHFLAGSFQLLLGLRLGVGGNGRQGDTGKESNEEGSEHGSRGTWIWGVKYACKFSPDGKPASNGRGACPSAVARRLAIGCG